MTDMFLTKDEVAILTGGKVKSKQIEQPAQDGPSVLGERSRRADRG